MKSEPTLTELKEEVTKLQREKKLRMQVAQTMQERNKLMNEIRQLEEMKKSPSALKSFGKSFKQGLKTLWSGIQGASKNLDRNAPELREMSKGMNSATKSKSRKKSRYQGKRVPDPMLWDLP